MANNWTYKKIEEIAEKVGMGPFGSSIKVETFVPDGIPVVSGQHLHGFRLDENAGFNFVTEEHANKLKNANVFRGDIIFTHAGNIKNVAYIPETSKYERYVASQRQFYMRCDLSKILPSFVVYYFNSHEGKYKLTANSSSVGVPSIAQPVSYLRKLEIPVPPLPEQRTIVGILGALDDKIEVNRRMNATLESMARAVFHQWFVVNEDIGRWRKGRLDDLLVLQRGFDLPSPQRIPGDYQIIAASGPSGTHNEFRVKGPGVTTGRSGVIGDVYFVHEDFWPLNTSLWVKEFKIAKPAFAYYLLKTLDFAIFNAGSAVPTLNRNHVHNLSLSIPPADLIDKFEEFTISLLNQRYHNEKELRTLASLRDSLLPKLMRGEVRVR